MAFLEADVQGSDHICHDLMDDITAIEDESAESREFIGNAHSVVMSADGVTIECVIDDVAENPEGDNSDQNQSDNAQAPSSNDPESVASRMAAASKAVPNPRQYQTGLKHFREVLEDWEAFILDDQSPA